MTKFKKLFIIFFFTFFINSQSYSSTSTVFIDIDYILNNSFIGKDIYYQLELINKQNLSILKKKKDSLNEKKNEINNKKNILSKKEIDKEIYLLNEEYVKFQNEKDKILKDFKFTKKNELDGFLLKIKPIIDKYMLDNSIDIILDQNQIFIGVSEKNITDIILKLVNNKFPKNE